MFTRLPLKIYTHFFLNAFNASRRFSWRALNFGRSKLLIFPEKWAAGFWGGAPSASSSDIFHNSSSKQIGNYQNYSLQQKVDDENSLGIIDFYLTLSISDDLARTSSETVFAEMFTDFSRGSSKQGSQQSRSSSAVTPLFSSLLVPCYCGEETTTHQLNSTFL